MWKAIIIAPISEAQVLIPRKNKVMLTAIIP
jgi:hypothetical protein